MTTVLQAKERKELRGSALKKLRQGGSIPAVLYGSKVESKPVSINSADLLKTIREVGRNGVISLDVEGSRQDVILTDYQQDHIKNEIVHADFLAVDKSSKLTVDVTIVLTGEAAGVKDGGVLQQPVHQVSVTTTPDQIPSNIEVDVTSLQVGETVTVADIPVNGEYTINNEGEEVIASILPPKQEEEINSGEQQESDPPENEEGRETQPSGE
ncbi:50S ribosomal protein L25/general stress protein Ctc [Neobacillus terrae]|uniref:50S ribosomal protein L25/general stress protein Ctc n=1 Tax=Neobacillus terrae TaxID=3034837 RepID=UPI00140A38AC|nr:50S ribosomal protein L25/general stress protein Ctc [Neobacillus terrae]NHM33493.1 50S ribosomal protein L25/general stress protein Ctc [Neobacillus terrae]